MTDTNRKIFTGWFFLGIINLHELIGLAILSAVVTKAGMVVSDLALVNIATIELCADAITLIAFLVWLGVRK